MPSFLWALPILSALGALGGRGACCCGGGVEEGAGTGSGSGFIAPYPLLPLEEEDPGSRGLLGVGVMVSVCLVLVVLATYFCRPTYPSLSRA